MKKFLCALFSMAICLCLISCNNGGYITRNKDMEKARSNTSVTLPDSYGDLEGFELELRKKADVVVAENYKIDSFDDYTISVKEYSEDLHIVRYTYLFHGYETDEYISVFFDSDAGELSGHRSDNKGYSNYLDRVSDEALKTAEDKLKAIGEGKYGDHFYAVCWDKEDYLCLSLTVRSEGPLLNGIPMDITHQVFYERLYS